MIEATALGATNRDGGYTHGVAYVAMSFVGMMAPQHMDFLSKITFPLLFGELTFMLWLVIRGARPKQALDPSLA